MAVETKNATGRRQISYASYDDLLTDAERLAAGNATTVGNWTLGQIFKHLAAAFEGSLDGMGFKAPLPLRLMLRLMKGKMLTRPLPSGYQIPSQVKATVEPAADVSTEESLGALREVIGRLKTDSTRAEHPFLGNLTRDEWDRFNLRHAEMHMSFAVPAD